MGWWNFRDEASRGIVDTARREKQFLIEQIRNAHLDWVTAQQQFEFSIGEDQVDYAIYVLEASEKRYEMLLKQAKQLRINLIDSDRLLEV